ncbi:vWA domain-containing protein [Streptomyces sp. RPT161]|uniref:vWA domain-containing protein n=1 Tax=Streptomyces sp. RPT161 TaxID=3015993 RepID=UPI0022B90B00|nr:VWA domain-containing protein [Streptomyces sp. RPT161]
MSSVSGNSGTLLPIYVMADESASMNANMAALNAGLAHLHLKLLAAPMAAAKVRFSVLGFADDVVQRMPLVDLRQQSEIPQLVARGTTSYQAAFEELLSRILRDVDQLKADGYKVHRPAVFFMTDGMPNEGEDWVGAHRRLTDRSVTKAAPNIISCGIGDADAQTIQMIATNPNFAYVSDGDRVGDAISSFCTALTQSVISSGTAMANGQAELIVEPPAGFRMVVDEI